MKKEFFRLINLKFIILLSVIIVSLSSASFMFYSQIQKLKDQIDNIYFGNFIPLLKLEKIVSDYKDIETIILTDKKYYMIKEYKEKILKEWKYYHETYKTKSERVVVDLIDINIQNSLDNINIVKINDILEEINFLINYEVRSALKQRKEFLKKYDNMILYLKYNAIVIIIFSLIFSILIILQISRKQNMLEKLNKKYKIDSITDGLTKLYNRAYFDIIFDKIPEIAKENNWNIGFVMIDIDYFKQYNDMYGHDKGDKALILVGNVLKNYFNKEFEYVFRLGGEEFGVILFDIDKNILINCLEQFKSDIANLKIEHNGSQVSDILSVSMGIVLIEPNSDMSPNRIYKEADKKLYISKNNGRNRYTI